MSEPVEQWMKDAAVKCGRIAEHHARLIRVGAASDVTEESFEKVIAAHAPVSQPEGLSDANADINDYLCAGHAQIWYTERNLLTKGKCWLCDGDKSNLHPEGGCAHLSAREFVDKWGPWEAGDSTEVAEIAEAYAAHCSHSEPSEEDVGWIVASDTGLTFRTINQGQIEWTSDRECAIRFARRVDAEMFSAEDEDAWKIIPYKVPR